jgi:CRISPR/Cas system CMR subunit Cmr4 (Cas7 group RAMP superfamily)
MRTASRWVTLCEVIRRINDQVQTDSEKDRQIRVLCAEALRKAKKVAKELSERDSKVLLKMWERNPTFDKDADRRIDDNYKQEFSRK